jgi:hypothetical protein
MNPTQVFQLLSQTRGGWSAGVAIAIHPATGPTTNVVDAGEYRVSLPLNQPRKSFAAC